MDKVKLTSRDGVGIGGCLLCVYMNESVRYEVVKTRTKDLYNNRRTKRFVTSIVDSTTMAETRRLLKDT